MKKFTRFILKAMPLIALVLGLLIYAFGCSGDSMVIEIFGGLFILAGLIIFAERKWAAEEK